MEALTNLVSVSIGNNGIKSLDNVKYLRRFSSLRLVNLSGNPICKARFPGPASCLAFRQSARLLAPLGSRSASHP